MTISKNNIEDVIWTLDIAIVPGSLIRKFKKRTKKFESKKEKNIARTFIYSIETARVLTYSVILYSIYDKIAS